MKSYLEEKRFFIHWDLSVTFDHNNHLLLITLFLYLVINYCCLLTTYCSFSMYLACIINILSFDLLTTSVSFPCTLACMNPSHCPQIDDYLHIKLFVKKMCTNLTNSTKRNNLKIYKINCKESKRYKYHSLYQWTQESRNRSDNYM